jgi:GNAT superfamily N-acetyltransferase
MKPNHFIFSLSEMKEYVQLYRERRDAVDWGQILELKDRPRIAFIQVLDENRKTELAMAGWGWENDVIKFGKIYVDKSVQRQGIADTIMQMFISIAKINQASKITGVIDGEEFLWNWYKKLGFEIYDGNNLLMELRNS